LVVRDADNEEMPDPKLPPPDPDPEKYPPGPAPVPVREPEEPGPDVIDPVRSNYSCGTLIVFEQTSKSATTHNGAIVRAVVVTFFWKQELVALQQTDPEPSIEGRQNRSFTFSPEGCELKAESGVLHSDCSMTVHQEPNESKDR
jgi:hypothetical protein